MLLTPFFAVVDDGILSSTNEGYKTENVLDLIMKPYHGICRSFLVRSLSVICTIELSINQLRLISLHQSIFESKVSKFALLRICSLALEALRNKSLKASIV